MPLALTNMQHHIIILLKIQGYWILLIHYFISNSVSEFYTSEKKNTLYTDNVALTSSIIYSVNLIFECYAICY